MTGIVLDGISNTLLVLNFSKPVSLQLKMLKKSVLAAVLEMCPLPSDALENSPCEHSPKEQAQLKLPEVLCASHHTTALVLYIQIPGIWKKFAI